jgi:dinuclear metal center YbgI/SA1388 family protein
MTATVDQIIAVLNRLAPPRLAESWDNVGLQFGDRAWPVEKIWVALDPLPEVVAEACENEVDLLVTHHPLFFKSLKKIDCATPVGRIVSLAAAGRLAIFSAHTNLDSATGGVNDVLAGLLGLDDCLPLSPQPDARSCKLVVFVPPDHVDAVLKAVFARQAGRIGEYTKCSFRSDGTGTFFAGDSTSPVAGRRGMFNEVGEQRVEVVVTRDRLDAVVAAARQAHPYETMAYDVYPLEAGDSAAGLGRVGRLSSEQTLGDIAIRLKQALQLSAVKIVGNPAKTVDTAAVCSGSGSSLLPDAIAAGAQVYVSGDIGYHTARDAQQAGIGIIDIGHFSSEHPIVSSLAAAIRDALGEEGIQAGVAAVATEKDPFDYL